jgi:hypothetical protein
MREQINSRPEQEAGSGGLDPRVHDALTDLHAYALLMDSQCELLGGRIESLARSDEQSEECLELMRRRAQLGDELSALREVIARLREEADAAGGESLASRRA